MCSQSRPIDNPLFTEIVVEDRFDTPSLLCVVLRISLCLGGTFMYVVFPTQRQSFPMLTIVYIENRLAPLYNFMTETMMTQDYSNPLVYWSVMGEMMSHFEVKLYLE